MRESLYVEVQVYRFPINGSQNSVRSYAFQLLGLACELEMTRLSPLGSAKRKARGERGESDVLSDIRVHFPWAPDTHFNTRDDSIVATGEYLNWPTLQLFFPI